MHEHTKQVVSYKANKVRSFLQYNLKCSLDVNYKGIMLLDACSPPGHHAIYVIYIQQKWCKGMLLGKH